MGTPIPAELPKRPAATKTMRRPDIARATLLVLTAYCPAWRPRRDLVIAACAGFLTMAIPHLAFHATHLSGFGTGGAIAELGALASLLIPPVVAIWASGAA
jgi:hypothetical protein